MPKKGRLVWTPLHFFNASFSLWIHPTFGNQHCTRSPFKTIRGSTSPIQTHLGPTQYQTSPVQPSLAPLNEPIKMSDSNNNHNHNPNQNQNQNHNHNQWGPHPPSQPQPTNQNQNQSSFNHTRAAFIQQYCGPHGAEKPNPVRLQLSANGVQALADLEAADQLLWLALNNWSRVLSLDTWPPPPLPLPLPLDEQAYHSA